MNEITVSAVPEQVYAITDFVNTHLERAGCPEGTRIEVDVAVDELFANIAHYAYGPETGTVTIRTETAKKPPSVTLTFIDQGIPFNPLAEEVPDTTALPARERPIGGLGLFMVRKIADEITYRYENGKNILTVRKLFEREE